MSDSGRSPRVRYRCRACGREFAPAAPGAAACPRCQSVARHERVAVAAADGGREGAGVRDAGADAGGDDSRDAADGGGPGDG